MALLSLKPAQKIGLILAIIAVLGTICIFYLYSQRFRPPNILVVGDSQISFGSGRAFMEFFSEIEKNCAPDERQKQALEVLESRTFGAIGVRSTSLHTWVTPDEKRKAMICDIDKKWGVNAGVYGISDKPDRRYVQIGQGKEYQFCKPDTSSFQAMFDNGYYNPKLIVLAFLGNSAERWAENEASALRDVKKTMEQIPPDTPCIFMTTAPSYRKEINDLRQVAQKNVKAAFNAAGSRCGFVEGFTPETRGAIQDNEGFFTRNDAGVVTDPHHPNLAAARKFFEIKTPDLCRVLFKQLSK